MQASQLNGAFALLKESMRLEEDELGARQNRMMELTDLAASMHNEVRSKVKCLLNEG